ncbi:MAG: hypothetical protein U1E76_14335 [Planctomycetota bacterium]
MSVHHRFAFAAMQLLAGLPLARAQSQPPIRIVFDTHVDPMDGIPEANRHDAYLVSIDDANWELDLADSFGARISFLSVGEFMEYVVEEGSAGPGAALLRRMYASGQQIGSHSHREWRRAAHDWPQFGADADIDAARVSWTDNIAWVDQAIMVALGPTLPEPIEAINSVKGAHLPVSESDYHALMREFLLGRRQAGPEEDYYAWFGHHIWTVFRPSSTNAMGEDLAGPFVVVPQSPTPGRAGVHHGIYQDMTEPNAKRMFLQAYLSWRASDRHGRMEKIWAIGWGGHPADFTPGGVERTTLVNVMSFLQDQFIGKHEPTGSTVAVWASTRETAQAYLDWEARHPGVSSFSFDSLAVDWGEYPYLRAAAEELEASAYQGEIDLGPDLKAHRLQREALDQVVLWRPVGSSTVDASGWVSAPVRIVDLETGRLLGTDPTAVSVGESPIIVTEDAPRLDWSGEARIGHTLFIDLYGRGGQRGVLYAAGGGLDASVPHHGRLLIDPTSGLLRVAAPTIAPDGVAAIRINIPNDPSLVGLTPHFQGLVRRFQDAGAVLTINDVVVTIGA